MRVFRTEPKHHQQRIQTSAFFSGQLHALPTTCRTLFTADIYCKHTCWSPILIREELFNQVRHWIEWIAKQRHLLIDHKVWRPVIRCCALIVSGVTHFFLLQTRSAAFNGWKLHWQITSRILNVSAPRIPPKITRIFFDPILVALDPVQVIQWNGKWARYTSYNQHERWRLHSRRTPESRETPSCVCNQ